MKRLLVCLMLLPLAGCTQSPPKDAAKEVPRKEVAKAPPAPIPVKPLAASSNEVPKKEAAKDLVTSAPVKPTTIPSNELLAFALRYGDLSADNQKKEYALVTQALGRDKNDLASRMKAALIFGLPSSRFRDDERALALLDDVLRDKRTEVDTRALAGLLKDYIGEHQRLADSATRADQKATEEQKRADDLQQKLDELKNIEKTLTERGQAGQK